jgi:hypothetical protein
MGHVNIFIFFCWGVPFGAGKIFFDQRSRILFFEDVTCETKVWAVITQRHMLAIHFCREEGQTRCENRNSCPGLRRVHIIACSCEMKLIIFRQKDKYLSRGPIRAQAAVF